MYKADKIVIITLFGIVLVITYFYDCQLKSSFLSGVMAWGGIVFGFLISTISTLFGSKFAKHLHECEDHSQAIHCSQLQILKSYFYTAASTCLFSTLLALLAELLPNSKIIFLILPAFIAVSVYLTWKIVKLLLRGLEEEVKDE